MEEKKKKKKAKLKLFGKKKSKKEDYHLPAPPAAYPQYQQTLTPHPDDKKKKKSGFKSKIKGLVRGRSKRNAKTGKDENSLYDEDYDPHNPPQQFMSGPPPRRNDGRNPELLAGIDYSDSSSGDSEFHQSLKPVREVDEDDYLSDEDIKDTSGQNFVHRAATSRRRNRLGPDSSDDNIEVMGKSGRDFLEIDELDEPVTLVTLLLDPDTLRFELLQLELDDPKDLKVQDVLDQLEESITESALQPLKFIALMDRKGGVHTADIVMIKAMAQRRDRNKDILVGYSKNSSVEEIFKRARPILGDPNVGRMLEMNGFGIDGWTKDRKKESALEEVRKVDSRSALSLKLQSVFVGVIFLFLLMIASGKGVGFRSKSLVESSTLLVEQVIDIATVSPPVS